MHCVAELHCWLGSCQGIALASSPVCDSAVQQACPAQAERLTAMAAALDAERQAKAVLEEARAAAVQAGAAVVHATHATARSELPALISVWVEAGPVRVMHLLGL